VPSRLWRAKGIDALVVNKDAMLIVGQALPSRASACCKSAKPGRVMASGASFVEMHRRVHDNILKGTRPSERPIEQPTKFHLSRQSQTAKTLGLTISPARLARANEGIELGARYNCFRQLHSFFV